MAVSVARKANLTVVEGFHNRSRVNPLREQECGGGIGEDRESEYPVGPPPLGAA